MEFKLTTQYKISPPTIETYSAFRDAIPKPSAEEIHLRHILRFYIARSLYKRGAQDVFILPQVDVNGTSIQIDVASYAGDKYTFAICEPSSITLETETILETLRDLDGIEIIVVYSQFGKPGQLPEKFDELIRNKKLILLTVVPPPFDDVYEYDIWMFETTFRNVFEQE